MFGMKACFHQILLVVAAVLMGWLTAAALLWLGWSTQIEGRAFRCNDDTYPFVWFSTDLNAHQSAGDAIGAGWTWEKIRRVQRLYQAAYYPLWLLVTALAYLGLSKLTAKSVAGPGHSPNGGSATP